MNNLPDYVIKSSSTVLRFAIQMDQSGPQNILQDEDCYFVGLTVGARILSVWACG